MGVGGMMRLNVCDGPGSVCDLVGVRLRAVSGLDGEDGGQLDDAGDGAIGHRCDGR